MRYAQVFVDVANRRLDQIYTYIIPAHLEINPGARVLVPLQKRVVQGIVVKITAELPSDLPPELESSKLRPVAAVLEGQPVPPDLIELALWLAETTICPVAQSLHTVWPVLKGKAEEWVIPLITAADPDLQAMEIFDLELYQAMTVLLRARRKALPLSLLSKRTGIDRARFADMLRRGWVKTEFRFTSNWRPGPTREFETEQGKTFVANVSNADILFSGSDAEDRFGTRDSSGSGAKGAFTLTDEQQEALKKITAGLATGSFQTLLLHGVTGSGKTEVYRAAIAQVLREGGDAILLVPEISLTSQIADYFIKEFPSELIILHSGLNAGAKAKAWEEILAGTKRLVIGARSAVFAPLANLRLIILDEEHDGAYKQGENPKYHAREVARKRMERKGGVVVLGSATPSLEAYAAARSGKIQLVTMLARVGQRPLPPVKVIDMREELAQGNRSIFSLYLQSALRQRLERGEQAMLFLNRRGYSTFVVCRECGHVARCPSCDVALTYHSQGQMMRCHYCNHEEGVPHRCPQCGSRYIRFFGQGTQRVEEELAAILPEAPVLRMDYDSTRTPESYRVILERFRRQEASILVGTQMIAKGLDFPNVTLVGVITADQTLNMPDFRSRERTFQLLTQVAGRAGRAHKEGEVVIQTYAPTDLAIVRASSHDFTSFFWEEINYRRERGYPPFTHVIRVLLQHEKEERVVRAAHELALSLQRGMGDTPAGNNGLDILGPAPAVLPKLKNEYRWQVSVKGKDRDSLRAFLHRGVQDYTQNPASSGIALNIEVDPLSG
ncbi:primosomal protein N' [Paradesulfitobacterium aromaticivorans]